MASTINEIHSFAELVSSYGIDIPMIQRDYVQGRIHETEPFKERKDDEARKLLKKYTDEREKRDKFISRLLSALLNPSSDAIQLTFLYGTVAHTSGAGSHQKDSFIPLDGQQRLTTLFLLSWALLYCQTDENRKEIHAKKSFELFSKGLHSLSYETRPSSGDFCRNLFSKDILPVEGCSSIHELIQKQVWFFDDWSYDPTVEAMMQMLDQMVSDIGRYRPEERKVMLENLLDGNGISFEILDMRDYRLTDGLYIKMNARGKQLTKFENWKSEFIGFLEEHHKGIVYSKVDKKVLEDVFSNTLPTLKEYFEYSIEHQWTDLFWTYCQEEIREHNRLLADKPNLSKRDLDCYPVIDEFFMNFFTAAHQTMYYTEHNTKDAKEFQDTLAQRNETFGNASNVKDLFEWLDLLKEFNDSDLYSKLFFIKDGNQYTHNGSIRLFDGKQVNLLTRCAKDENFTVIVQIILYGLLRYAQTFGTQNLVSDTLKSYLRQIRNMVEGDGSVCSIKKDTVDVVNTCQIIDVYSFKRRIDQLINEINGKELFIPSTEQAEIEDFDFVNGYLAANLLQTKDNPSSDVNLSSLRDMLKAWDAMDEYKKIAILVAYGYNGKYILSCAHGWTYLFGNNNRWKPIFMRDSDLKPVLVSMLVDFQTYSAQGLAWDEALNAMLAAKKPSSFNFIYYALTYRAFIYSAAYSNRTPYMYFSIRGNRDALDICSIPYSGKPMLATHTDPIIFAMVDELFKGNTQKKKLYLQYRFYTSGGERVHILVYETPKWDGLPEIAEIRHVPGEHGTGGWEYGNVFEKDTPDMDRVKAGVKLLRRIYPDYDFAEKGSE